MQNLIFLLSPLLSRMDLSNCTEGVFSLGGGDEGDGGSITPPSKIILTLTLSLLAVMTMVINSLVISHDKLFVVSAPAAVSSVSCWAASLLCLSLFVLLIFHLGCYLICGVVYLSS